MKHYCVFEITRTEEGNPRSRMVEEFGNDYESANEYCESMNNFIKKGDKVNFILRCLEKEEFENIDKYNPFLTSIKVKKTNIIK